MTKEEKQRFEPRKLTTLERLQYMCEDLKRENERLARIIEFEENND